jgi:DNA-binding NarL/FixJ family response regulator
MRKTAVLLVDDHTIVREGLRALLDGETDVEIVGEAENGQKAIVLAKSLRPDVVVMDIAMPILNGLEATRVIKKENPQVKIIVLSMYTDDEFVSQVIRLGASGYLAKQTAAADLRKAIREVMLGNAYFSPSISRMIVERLSRSMIKEQDPRPFYALTSREIQILQLITEGLSNKEISLQLEISVKTVEKHREHIMRKLDIHDVAGLTRYAISKGIITGQRTASSSSGF